MIVQISLAESFEDVAASQLERTLSWQQSTAWRTEQQRFVGALRYRAIRIGETQPAEKSSWGAMSRQGN